MDGNEIFELAIEKKLDISNNFFMNSISIVDALRVLKSLYEFGFTHIINESYITDYGGRYDYDDVGTSGEPEIVSKFVAVLYKKNV